MEGSNLRFLIQSQASYHWTNPQNWRSGAGISSGPAAAGKGNRPAISNMIIPAGRFVKGCRQLICRAIAHTGQHPLPSFPQNGNLYGAA